MIDAACSMAALLLICCRNIEYNIFQDGFAVALADKRDSFIQYRFAGQRICAGHKLDRISILCACEHRLQRSGRCNFRHVCHRVIRFRYFRDIMPCQGGFSADHGTHVAVFCIDLSRKFGEAERHILDRVARY